MLFHVPGLIAFMDGRQLLNTLPFIAAVVELFLRHQVLVALARPVGPPFFGSALVVPVGCRHALTLPDLTVPRPNLLLAGRRVYHRHPLALLVQPIAGLLLFAPFPGQLDGPDREHDMSMGVPVPLVMERPIGAHPPVNEVRLYIVLDDFQLRFAGQIFRKSDLDLPGELGVAPLFHLLDFVPENFPVLIFFRGVFGQHHLAVDDTAFLGIVMYETGLFIFQFLATSVCGAGDRRPAASAANDFN